MKPELAKQLKDAGFPQKEDCGHCEYTWLNENWVPTLSELIEVCVEMDHEKTFNLENIKDNALWWAEMRHFGIIIAQTKGSDPEEAVAKLWLALNKKI